MKISKIVLFGMIIMLSVGFNTYLKAATEEKTIPTDSLKEEFLKTDFSKLIFDARKLPTEIQKVFSGRMKLANPGKEYNSADLIDPSLPCRRLFFAGAAQKIAFVYYEHGGYVLTYRLALFALDDKGKVSTQNVYVLEAEQAKDIDSLKLLLKDVHRELISSK